MKFIEYKRDDGSTEWRAENYDEVIARGIPEPPPNPAVVSPEEMEIYEKSKYKTARTLEYPPLTELADAVFWQAQGDSTKMDEYVAKVAAVKANHPKPE